MTLATARISNLDEPCHDSFFCVCIGGGRLPVFYSVSLPANSGDAASSLPHRSLQWRLDATLDICAACLIVLFCFVLFIYVLIVTMGG